MIRLNKSIIYHERELLLEQDGFAPQCAVPDLDILPSDKAGRLAGSRTFARGAIQFEIRENSNIPPEWFQPLGNLSDYLN